MLRSLRPSILAELQNEDHELKSFVQIVKKEVVAEAKANLRSRATTKNMDQHCPRGSWSAHITAAKTSAPQPSDNAETSEKARKENKDRNQTPRHITHLSNWIIQSLDPASVWVDEDEVGAGGV